MPAQLGPCKVTTTPFGDAVEAVCRCGWSRRVERRSQWPDGLPLKDLVECQELAEQAARAHVSRPAKDAPPLPPVLPPQRRRRRARPVAPPLTDDEIERTRQAWRR